MVFPDSPAGRAAAWFLDHTASQGRDLTVDDVAAHMAFGPPWTPTTGLQRFLEADPRPLTVTTVKETGPHTIEVVFDYGDERPFKVSLAVEEDAPHRIVWLWWGRAIPDDIVIRRAEPGDAPGLNALEVRAPMTVGAATVVYDRGEDFLGFARLMEENVCFVAERDGELLGLACGAAHTVRIGGARYRVMLLHHLRVPVEHRKSGIFSTLNGHVFASYEGRTDGAYGYTAVDNAEAMRIGGPGTWETAVYRAVLDCRALAGGRHGRRATPADAAEVVDILNRAHDAEEMYLPYTPDSLAARMERAPDLYTWEQLVVGEGAVLGIWPAGLGVTIENGGPAEIIRAVVRAVVLDHGFVPGASDEFERLLRSGCADLLDRGHTELMILTSDGSPNLGLVSELAARMDVFAFRMAVPEPEGTVGRGVYVDAVYF